MGKLIERIRRFNRGRDPERLAMKYANMRSGAFVFLRATCHLYYERLPQAGILEKAPATWACGDLHLENFGSYKGDNRQVYFDINDFDEGVLAPATWDAVRFMSSILVGRDTLNADQAGATALCQLFVDAWAGALAEGQARWVERETATGAIRSLLEGLRSQQRRELLDRRTVKRGNRRRLRTDGRRGLAASEAQREAVTRCIDSFARTQRDPAFFRVIDVARRIAGNGSLGLDRFIVLVHGKGAPDGHYLLDLKACTPSALAKHTPIRQPRWRDEAQRVVAIERRMQAIPPAFLHALSMDGRPYLLRDMQPSADRVSLAEAARDPGAIASLIDSMAHCLAWAQLRSSGRQGSAKADALIDFGRRRRWRRRLVETAWEAARRVERDWAAYCKAYDEGAFRL
jgi:uncharacterized protein (DUF2252 family)